VLLFPKRSNPVIVEDAPFPFLLVGPVDGHRGVLVRSAKLDLLLLGATMLPGDLAPPKMPEGEKAESLVMSGLDPENPTATVSVVQVEAVPGGGYGIRREPFTLAWMGRSPARYVNRLKQYFANCASEIHRAISSDPQQDIRGLLAPLLFLCAQATSRRPVLPRVWAVLQIIGQTVLGCLVLFTLLAGLVALIQYLTNR
jgi:hypothetical protein